MCRGAGSPGPRSSCEAWDTGMRADAHWRHSAVNAGGLLGAQSTWLKAGQKQMHTLQAKRTRRSWTLVATPHLHAGMATRPPNTLRVQMAPHVLIIGAHTNG